jgi:hypothetical protein
MSEDTEKRSLGTFDWPKFIAGARRRHQVTHDNDGPDGCDDVLILAAELERRLRVGYFPTTSAQNVRGEWVPAIPLPFYGSRFVACECGRKFWSVFYRTDKMTKRYCEHYAYAHILGMES